MSLLARDIWDGLRAQPGRVGLSFLAVAVGMLALTAQRAISGGLQERARRLVDELGAQVVAILPPETRVTEGEALLTSRHAALLAANLGGRPVSRVRAQKVVAGGLDRPLAVVETDPQLAGLRRWRMRDGRFFDAADEAAGARHAVITAGLAARARWHVGTVITLQNLPFTVVGVVEAGGLPGDDDSPARRLAPGAETVFVLHAAALPWTRQAAEAGRPLDTLFVGGRADDALDVLVERCRGVLAAPDAGPADFTYVTPDTLLAGLRRLQATIRWSVGSIAALCLLLGGTTLMSLMLANVRDRVGEIGLRRALGARARDVAALFVLEACLVTLAAAAAGGLVAALVLWPARARFPAPLVFGPGTFLVPVLASVGLGIIFSYWPARMASRISPAEALRNE